MQKRVGLFLGILQVFVAVGAIPAGLSMIFEPDGSGLGLSSKVLVGSPFQDFFIPGLFLFFVNGLLNALGAVFSIKRKKYAGIFGLVLGIILLLWICIQVYFIGLTHFLQPLFFAVGVVELILSYIYIRKEIQQDKGQLEKP
ncbi:MAG: hypothetical protein ACI8P3_002775 [Saprospiraceae bacterium]